MKPARRLGRPPQRVGLEQFSRPPLARMMQLHHQLQARKFPNCRKLAHELEVSEKTIQRDIEFMRYQLGLPIEYDQLHFGFVYTEPVTSFPNIQVSEGEIVALFVAQKALQQYRGTPFEAPLRAAFQKIGHGLKDRISFSWSDLDAAISFRSVGQSVADLEVFELLSRAVLDSAEVEFRYRKLRSNAAETRRVRPYHLGCVDQQWYLFAFDLARQQVRTFALPRISGPRRTGARFRRPANFSIGKFLDSSFGVFQSEGRTTVRIRFRPFAAQLVRERMWHHSQKIKELRDGGLELNLQLGSLEEIERWVLSWGDEGEVLEPAKLRERLAAVGRKFVAQYSAK
ncbi:MAG TPA: WYL domain-containing transcriptional regulator [Chthoniobacterales bacterium]|jgi:proteasome accessory factor B|nr:WYL domain-containing transcriptional regulator [Chthoniobacterales bacterium]